MIIEIVEAFKKIYQVEEVKGFKVSANNYHFKVITTNEKYDRKLMMKLLDVEYFYTSRFNDIFFTFQYLPKILLEGNENEPIPQLTRKRFNNAD